MAKGLLTEAISEQWIWRRKKKLSRLEQKERLGWESKLKAHINLYII